MKTLILEQNDSEYDYKPWEISIFLPYSLTGIAYSRVRSSSYTGMDAATKTSVSIGGYKKGDTNMTITTGIMGTSKMFGIPR